jgi:hypothetical protein
MQKPPGVARQLVTFLVLPRKVTKRSRPRFAAPAGFPALLDWSGGCGTRTIRYASTCSNSPRRHLLTSLRYSAAHRGKMQNGFVCATRTFFGKRKIKVVSINYFSIITIPAHAGLQQL